MPIPYREADGVEELGEAAFLKIDPSPTGQGYVGALFLINARGEPVEFTYSRVEVPHAVLWQAGDARRFAARKLAASLLSLCPRVPRVLLCLAEDVERELFLRDVQLSLAVCLVAPAAESGAPTASSEIEGPPTPRAADVFWLSERPAEVSNAMRLLHELTSRSLVLEPFGRASRGLREVYGPVAGVETP